MIGAPGPLLQQSHGKFLPEASPPEGKLVPPVGIPATKKTYWEAVATPALYVRRGGVGTPMADNYVGPYMVLKRGTKTFKLQLGKRVKVVRWDQLNPLVGLAPPVAA